MVFYEIRNGDIYKSMRSSLKEFRKKEIINITDGTKIGYVDDISFELLSSDMKVDGLAAQNAIVTHLIVRGRYKFFGILGKNDDLLIPWGAIQIVGQDTLLINISPLNKSDGSTVLNQKEVLPLTDETIVKETVSTSKSNGIIDFIKNIF